jgi:hypothetical protein
MPVLSAVAKCATTVAVALGNDSFRLTYDEWPGIEVLRPLERLFELLFLGGGMGFVKLPIGRIWGRSIGANGYKNIRLAL